MKLDLYLTSHTNIHSEWTKDLKIRPEMVKLPEENIKEKIGSYVFWLFHQKLRQQKQKQTHTTKKLLPGEKKISKMER
jgi:hypothetical protein